MVKNKKKSSSVEPLDRFQRNLVCIFEVPIIVYINHDLGLTLTYFTARSILVVNIGFSKVKTLNFFGRFVACDLKIGRYRQHVELMKCCEYQRSRSFLDLGQRSFIN